MQATACQTEDQVNGFSIIQTSTLSIFRFPTLSGRLWAFAQMGLARPRLARTGGLKFWKLLGSGIGEGFTPVPNTAVYAILCVWDSREAAERALAEHSVFAKYRKRSTEHLTLMLRTLNARGQWSSVAPFEPNSERSGLPLAALTRATIKPSILLRFWQRVPKISAVIGQDQNVIFKVGLGEVPWLHQVTFSIWPDEASMAEFARKSGPHADAIAAVRSGHWFREELYARFEVIDQIGSWKDSRLKQEGDRA